MDLDLDNVIKLFLQKHTAGLADRQATAIVHLCKSMVNEDQQRGFVFRELPQVAQVLDLINGRLLDRKVSGAKTVTENVWNGFEYWSL